MNRLCDVVFLAIAVVLCFVLHSSATPAPADQQITVTQFVIEGADSLSASQIEEVKASVMGKSESPEVLMDSVRHLLTTFLNSSCYIRPDIDLEVVNAQATPDSAWMHAKVRQGTRYRLSNFRVQWAQAFSAQEIEQHLPLDAMRRGDCSGLADVESTVIDSYRSRGFPNVKVHPLVQANKATEQFDLTLYIDEGK
jgi:outer membrane protein assembly factor BamA